MKIKKMCKRMLSMVLVVVLLVCSLQLLATAKDAPGEIPIVEVLGAFHRLYYDAGTENQTTAFNPTSVGQVVSGIFGEKMLELVKGRLLKLQPYALTDSLAELLAEQFDVLAFHPDGTPVHDLDGNLPANEWFLGERPAGEKPPGDWRFVTMDRIYIFDFDWRDSPLRNADLLHAYIQRVKAHSGHDKVNISLQSGSTGVGLAYLEKYGTGDLNVYWSSMSLHSSTMFGEIMNKRIHFDEEALFNCNIITGMHNETVDTVLEVLGYFNEAGLLRLLFDALYIVLRPTMVERIFDQFITECIATIPVMWTYVPAQDHDSAIEAQFGGEREKYAGLISLLDEYHSRVGSRQEEILAAAAQEIPVGLFCSYGSSQLPLASGTNVNSDTLVDLKYSSLGATASAPDSVLQGKCGKPYTQAVADGHNHLSPDGQVDASTCLLPETTWFSNDGDHFQVVQIKRIRNWFYDTEGATVHTNPDYPQFLQINPAFDMSRCTRENLTVEYYTDPTIAVAYLPQEAPQEPEPAPVWRQATSVLLRTIGAALYMFTWWLDTL